MLFLFELQLVDASLFLGYVLLLIMQLAFEPPHAYKIEGEYASLTSRLLDIPPWGVPSLWRTSSK